MYKICGETKHEAKECWMRHVTLNNKEWTEGNMGSPLQIDLSRVIKSPVHKNEECPICMENMRSATVPQPAAGINFVYRVLLKVAGVQMTVLYVNNRQYDTTVVRRLFRA